MAATGPATKGALNRRLLDAVQQGASSSELHSILEQGASPNACDPETGSNALQMAASAGNVAAVAALLNHGAAVGRKRGMDGKSALHIAAEEGHPKVVAVLLDHGSDPLQVDEDGWTPLHWACYYGDVAVAKVLLGHQAQAGDASATTGAASASQQVTAGTLDGRSHLELALTMSGSNWIGAAARFPHNDDANPATSPAGADTLGEVPAAAEEQNKQPLGGASPAQRVHDYAALVELLVNHGMDVAEHDSQALKAPGGLPSIMQAVAEGGGGRLVEVLVAAGADPDAGAGGATPLYVAASAGRAAEARALLAAGAELEASTPAGTTPVAAALQGGHHQVALMLVQADASVLRPDNDGLTPLHHAATCSPLSTGSTTLQPQQLWTELLKSAKAQASVGGGPAGAAAAEATTPNPAALSDQLAGLGMSDPDRLITPSAAPAPPSVLHLACFHLQPAAVIDVIVSTSASCGQASSSAQEAESHQRLPLILGSVTSTDSRLETPLHATVRGLAKALQIVAAAAAAAAMARAKAASHDRGLFGTSPQASLGTEHGESDGPQPDSWLKAVASAKGVVQVLLNHGADCKACNASGVTAGALLLQLLSPGKSSAGPSVEQAADSSMPLPIQEILNMLQ